MVDPILRRALVRAAGKALEGGLGRALQTIEACAPGRVSKHDALSILSDAFQSALKNVGEQCKQSPARGTTKS